jgi:hypothetical protein
MFFAAQTSSTTIMKILCTEQLIGGKLSFFSSESQLHQRRRRLHPRYARIKSQLHPKKVWCTERKANCTKEEGGGTRDMQESKASCTPRKFSAQTEKQCAPSGK